MNDFLTEVVTKTGVDLDTAKSATGALLKAARENLPAEDYAKLADNVEDVDGLIDQSLQEAEPQAGIKQAAQGALGRAVEAVDGEKAGSLGIGALLAGAGLKPDQMPKFVSMFLEHIRDRVGSDVAGNMVSKMSGLLDLQSGDLSI